MSKLRQNLIGVTATTAIVPPVLGGVLANSGPVASIFRAQDSLLVNGRRIVASQSLDQANFSIPETSGTSPSATYHTATDGRIVHRQRVHLTPGYLLRLSVLALPSGLTQVVGTYGEILGYVPDGAQGRVRVTVTWTDRSGATVATTHEVELKPSTLEYAALPTYAGGLWGMLLYASIPLIAPTDYATTDELARWSKHCAATVIIRHYGGTRVVDCVLHEEPYGIALDTADAAGNFVTGLNSTSTANGYPPTFTHPLQRRSESPVDPRVGTHTLLDVAEAQANRLGPTLLSWTAWSEAQAVVGDVDEVARSTSSTSFVGLVDETRTAYNASHPGWSFSSGGFARRWGENHPLAVLGKDGSIPVRVWVYGASSDAAGGTVRVQTAPWSWVDVTITSTLGWHRAYGHLRVGSGPGDPVVAQAFMRKTTSGTLSVYALDVEYGGAFASAV